MVGTPRQHDDMLALPARLGDDVRALFAHKLHVLFVLRIGGIDSILHRSALNAGEMLCQRLRELFGEILAPRQIEVVIDQLGFSQLGAVARQHLGIIGDHRAVVVIVAQMLV